MKRLDNLITPFSPYPSPFTATLQFKESMMGLAICRRTLQAWMDKREDADEWKASPPALLLFFLNFHATLLSKASFYFFDMLREQAVRSNLEAQGQH